MSLFERLLVHTLVLIIRGYQRTLSLDHGPARRFFPYGYCRFHPTCSEYSIQALERFGLLPGLWKSLKRILRCHPWSKGGIDPVK